MRALVARKLGMTQIFAESGVLTPVTIVQAGPCVVTQVRTPEKDGYSAVQLGYGQAKKLSRALRGQFALSKSQPKVVMEVRAEIFAEEAAGGEVPTSGDKWDVSLFEVGEKVAISGTSKGKGFAGTIKRHNFSRGPKTHGSRSYRRPGSIGSMYPQKIWKGKKMAGRMGKNQVSLKNVLIADIDAEQNLLALKGAIPGSNGNFLIVKAPHGQSS